MENKNRGSMQLNNKFATYVSCFLMMAFGMVLTIMSPLLSEISNEFSLSMSQSGLIFTVSFIGFIIFVFIAGFLADHFGKKLVLSISALGFTLSLFLFSISSSFYSAIAFIFLIGGFGGVLESMISALVAELNTENPGYYINMAQVFFSIGALFGPILGGSIVSSGLGWRTSYYILSGFALLCSFIFVGTKFSSNYRNSSLSIADFKELVSDKIFLGTCLCMALYTGSEVGAWGWMSTYLKSDMKFSTNKSSIAVGVFWVSMLIGRLVCGKLSERYSIRKLILILAYFSSAATILSGVLSNEFSMWVIITLMGLSYSSLYPFIVSFGSDNCSKPSSTSFSLLVASGSLGTIVIPYLMGVIGEFGNIKAAMITPGVLLLLLALVFLRIRGASTTKRIRQPSVL